VSYLAIAARPVATFMTRVTLLPLPAEAGKSVDPAALQLDSLGSLGFLLSASKLPLGALIMGLVAGGSAVTAAALLLLFVIVDVADGVVFASSAAASSRTLRRSRRLLDTLTDRILIGGLGIVSLITQAVPAHIVALLLGREALLAVVAGIPFLSRGIVLKPNIPSRCVAAAGAVLAAAYLVGRTVSPAVLSVYIVAATGGLILYVTSPRPE